VYSCSPGYQVAATDCMTLDGELKCPICLEAPPPSEGVELSCRHQICRLCLGRYLVNRIDSGQVRSEHLTCPWPECNTELPEESIKQALAIRPKAYDRLQKMRAEACAMKGTLRSRSAQCPTPGCPLVLVPEEAGDVTCPHCLQLFCTRCGRKAHRPRSCRENAAMLDDLPDLPRCPRCSVPVELASGCKFLKCPVCENGPTPTFFCYLCGEALDKSEHYTHYQDFPEGPFGAMCRGLWARRKQASPALRPRSCVVPRAPTPAAEPAARVAGVGRRVSSRPPRLLAAQLPPPAAMVQGAAAAASPVPERMIERTPRRAPRPPPYPVAPPPPLVEVAAGSWNICWASGPRPPLVQVQDVHVELSCLALERRSTMEVPYRQVGGVNVPMSAFPGDWEVRIKFRGPGSDWGPLSKPAVLPRIHSQAARERPEVQALGRTPESGARAGPRPSSEPRPANQKLLSREPSPASKEGGSPKRRDRMACQGAGQPMQRGDIEKRAARIQDSRPPVPRLSFPPRPPVQPLMKQALAPSPPAFAPPPRQAVAVKAYSKLPRPRSAEHNRGQHAAPVPAKRPRCLSSRCPSTATAAAGAGATVAARRVRSGEQRRSSAHA